MPQIPTGCAMPTFHCWNADLPVGFFLFQKKSFYFPKYRQATPCRRSRRAMLVLHLMAMLRLFIHKTRMTIRKRPMPPVCSQIYLYRIIKGIFNFLVQIVFITDNTVKIFALPETPRPIKFAVCHICCICF